MYDLLENDREPEFDYIGQDDEGTEYYVEANGDYYCRDPDGSWCYIEDPDHVDVSLFLGTIK